MRAIIVALGWIVVLISAAGAQTTDGCADLDTQSGQNECFGTSLTLADGALQAAYDRLRSSYTHEQGARLRDAQRAWIAYHDDWCAFESMAVERGSMHPTVVAACKERLTAEQTKRLVYQLTCTGDVDCVGG